MALREAHPNPIGRTGPNRRPSAKEAFRKLKQDRERYEQAGLGPGDAYRGMWAYLHDSLAALRQAKTEERRDYFRREYATTLYRLLPFERPRLQTVKLQGDPDRPVMNQEQMAEVVAKMLTQEEIAILDKVAAGHAIIGAEASRRGGTEPPPPRRRKVSPAAGNARLPD
jgi:hypothetical protein